MDSKIERRRMSPPSRFGENGSEQCINSREPAYGPFPRVSIPLISPQEGEEEVGGIDVKEPNGDGL